MNLSGLMDTVRNALGLGTPKPAAPAPRATAQTPAPTPRPAPAPVAPRPAPAPAPAAAAPATGGATLVRAVRAGGKVLAVGTAVKVVATHGKGTAYTVQLPGVATAKTIEGAAIRVG
ncbi:MAG: hypothetical protein ACRYGC_05635 [Janthinobacterium lividum]